MKNLLNSICARRWFAMVLFSSWILVAAAQALAGQAVLYVDDDAAAGGDGSSWVMALDDVQDALGIAEQPGSGVSEVRVG